MSNWMVFFVMAFISMQVMSMFIEGEVALATTVLNTPLTKTATTIQVEGTDGFLSADFVIIDDEEICYTTRTSTTFTGLTRGCRDSSPAEHPAGKRVYNDATALINRIVGFNVLQTLANDGFISGSIKLVTSLPSIVKGFMNMAIWNYSFLEGTLVWFKYMILFPLSAGLIFSLFQLVFRRG